MKDGLPERSREIMQLQWVRKKSPWMNQLKKVNQGVYSFLRLIKFCGEKQSHIQGVFNIWLNTKTVVISIQSGLMNWEYIEFIHYGQILNEKNGKQKINRFNKVFDKRIMEEFDEIVEDQYFDPAFQEVDRVLSCTEIFPIVHPKKGSEMKGKWA